MKFRFKWLIGLGLISAWSLTQRVEANNEHGFEVWATEQSGTAGQLYIYDSEDLIKDPSAAVPEVVDLGDAVSAQCAAETGSPPTRAHILLFNPTQTVGILAYVASGHVVFIDAATRTPMKCLRMSAGFGGARQAHAAFPAPNGKYVIVANQNGRLLERINTDANPADPPYSGPDDILHDTAATLDMVSCTTNAGRECQAAGVRPTNNVVCPIIDHTSTLTFVTLSGGGMLVADTSAGGAPPAIVAEYDVSTVGPNGCGGMQASTQAAGRIYINSGAGAGNTDSSDLYSFPADASLYSSNSPNTPAPILVYSFRGAPPANDSHGITLVTKKDRYLWVSDRATNEVVVVKTAADTLSNLFSLVGEHSADPAPDLMAVSPKGKYVFIALRGPCPLTANVATVNNAVGATPGVMVVKAKEGGKGGEVLGIASITKPSPAAFNCASRTDDDGAPFITEQADPHGIAVRSLGDVDED